MGLHLAVVSHLAATRASGRLKETFEGILDNLVGGGYRFFRKSVGIPGRTKIATLVGGLCRGRQGTHIPLVPARDQTVVRLPGKESSPAFLKIPDRTARYQEVFSLALSRPRIALFLGTHTCFTKA